MRRSGPATVFVTLVAGIAAFIAAHVSSLTASMEWFTPSNPERYSLSSGVWAMFFAAMLVFGLASLFSERAHAQPVVAGCIVAIACVIPPAIAAGIGVGAMMSGGAQTLVNTIVIVGLAITGAIAMFAIGRLPNRGYERTGPFVQAAIALVMLAIILVPWPRVRLAAMIGEEREAHARKTYGRTYDVARRTIVNCPGFTLPIGGLQRLAISTRRNMLERPGDYDRAYFDFDYTGRTQRGRATLLFDYHPGLETERMIELRVYPHHGERWTNVSCWLAGLPPSSSP